MEYKTVHKGIVTKYNDGYRCIVNHNAGFFSCCAVKLFSIPALKDIGDQIEYLPPTVSGNGTMQFSEKPIEIAFCKFAVITIEFFSFLSPPNHLKHDKVSSVESDFEEKM